MKNRCIHELIQDQAAHTPDAPAVEHGDAILTYGELDRRANQLAHHLRKLGVGPEVLVALCVERSPEMAIGLLGVLKAGGAYVPLDPTWPQERRALILADTRACVLLTQQHLVEKLPANGATIVRLDTDWSTIAQENRTRPENRATSGNLAYVIFTSGSTGRPKGVPIPHQALVNHSTAVARYYGLGSSDRVLQFASIGFDVAAEEIFPSWLSGATVVLRSDSALASLTSFLRFVEQEGLTVLNLPSPYWHEWVADLSRARAQLPSTLGLVIVGSDRTLSSRLSLWLQLAGERVRWIHAYGPTEATITATLYEPAAYTEPVQTASVPIGHPIANMQVYLLDQEMKPVPAGAAGEMYIGGIGLARGYLDDCKQTAHKFVPDPFSPEPGRRMFRTGDLARRLPDGALEFLGRGDDQIKIRGFRVEPSEVEATLGQHPSVRETVVISQGDARGEKHLVAFVVPTPGWTPASAELSRFVQDRLPAYMTPSAIVLMDRLPLTPSGKVDRQVLAMTQDARPELKTVHVAPRTPIEDMLANIWAEALGVERVGIHDNFFELGGHSLLATQIASRMRAALQIEMSLPDIFGAPTVADLAGLVERLGYANGRSSLPPVLRIARDSFLPVSFPQEPVWFLNQLAPGNLAYNTQLAIRFHGNLDIVALQRTLTEIIRRHEIFRTRFSEVDGQAVQIVSPPYDVTLPIVNLEEIAETERETEAEKLICAECRRPFDLTRIPLVRWTLLRLADREHILVQVEHHFVHDGWSLARLLYEIKVIYLAFSTGQPSPLPEPAIQFADYVVWQRQWMQGEVLEQRLAYWKRKLAGTPPLLELPADHPRPKTHSFRGAAQVLDIPAALSESLRMLSRREGVSLFMTMLAAFKTLLYRYTEQTDIVVGTAVGNRPLREMEELIGMVVNTIVLRTSLAGNPTFRELLPRIRETALSAYAHQDMPFEKLVEALQPARDVSHNPLFQVTFSFHDSPVPDLEWPGLIGELIYRYNDSAKFDLNIVVMPRPPQDTRLGREDGVIRMEWEYSTDLFDAATITRMLGHYRMLIEGIAADPNRRLSDLTLLTEAEQRQLTVEWNSTRASYPRDRRLHQLFECQAEANPDAVAVIFEDEHLTYRELDRRANQLARYLATSGIHTEMLVGICMERSVEIITGILGVLKAGAAYVPLDPAYPIERLSTMIEDAHLGVCLTQDRLRSTLGRLHWSDAGYLPPSGRLICLDSDWPAIAFESQTPPASEITAQNLAYVLFTSGSTGRPKGVACCHAGVLNLLADFDRRQPLSTQDRCSLWTGLSFDVSVYEIFSALLAGGALDIIPDDVRPEGPPCLQWLNTRSIHSAYLPPFMLNELHEWLEKHGQAYPLRRLLVGVEPIPEQLLAGIRRLAPDLAVINGYGPTEATVCATLYSVQPQSARNRNTPIGGPVQNMSVYVLDARLQPVPIGVPGKLYIGGVGLARGYLGKPDWTAEKFIPNPFSNEPGERLYDTGDLARYLPEGKIEFLGRADYQVKLRGFRVELGEIEATLAEHPSVQETVVMVRKDTPDDKRLVAYVVPNREQALSTDGLRIFLKQRLPDYMIPASFVILDILPVTPNGKLDRRALPVPERVDHRSKDDFVPPRNPIEQTLADVWRQVLGIERVSVNDNFFALGGHSLMATRIISRIRDAFRVELALHSLFEAPTIAGLAEIILYRQLEQADPQALAQLLDDLDAR